MGKLIEASGQQITASVRSIQNKTAKPIQEQDARKMALTALAKIGAINVDPLSGQFYLTGAIAEFNKDIRNNSWSRIWSSKNDESVINVAMDIRLSFFRKNPNKFQKGTFDGEPSK